MAEADGRADRTSKGDEEDLRTSACGETGAGIEQYEGYRLTIPSRQRRFSESW